MSIQFGIWNFDGRPVDPHFLDAAAECTARYGRDALHSCVRGPFAIFFQSFHTTTQSLEGPQPIEDDSGVILTWDGRLDNRDDLLESLNLEARPPKTDPKLVLSAYLRWGANSFANFLGDWALSVWDPSQRILFLAKDFLGTRQLYYKIEGSAVIWSTVLDPLLLGCSFEISEEFVAGYLSTFPACHITPYRGINAVPASTFVQIRQRSVSTTPYWRFTPNHRVTYKRDAEYEEHFLALFRQAVRRRLRASAPVLAELSGGMDSSSIVCVADALMTEGRAETPRIDTISYYDDHEPNWNESPYFSRVEQQRERTGYHLDIGSTAGAFLPAGSDFFFPLPGFDRRALNHAAALRDCLQSGRSRVLLSGLGGDEFLGGVPTPVPELQDYFVALHARHFLRQLMRWSLTQRRPLLGVYVEAARGFLPQFLQPLRSAPWLNQQFVRRNSEIFRRDEPRIALWRSRPSFQAAISTLDHIRRELNCCHLDPIANHLVTYPILDRELLVFLFAIPREQLLRPGERRSLMRRSLIHLVPREILERKRKAYLARQPISLIQAGLPAVEGFLDSGFMVTSGWADKQALSDTVANTLRGKTANIVSLLVLFKLEIWLQSLFERKVLRECPIPRNERGTLERGYKIQSARVECER
jgi:asparagine synthase (glutamine-hydrolysing)